MMNGLCLGTCSSRGGREEYTPAAGRIHHRICVGEYLGAAEKVVPTIVGFVSDGWIGPLIPSRDGLNREVYGLAGTRPRESGGERERES